MPERTPTDTNGNTGQSGQTGSPGQPQRPHLSARAAAEALGINERTVRRWLDEGKISAPKVRGAYRFDPDEIERARLALIGEDESGNVIIEAKQPDTGGPNRVPGHDRTDRADRSAADAAAAALSVSARSQLESIRDEWLQPLVEQLKDQAEEIGQLKEAERRERDRADAAVQDAEDLRAEIDALRASREATTAPEKPVDEGMLNDELRPTAPTIAPGSPNPEAPRPLWRRLLGI